LRTRVNDVLEIGSAKLNGWYDAVIRVCDGAANVIETHEQKDDFKEWWSFPRFISALPAKNDLLRRKLTFRSQH
jgi:hypothetical protein